MNRRSKANLVFVVPSRRSACGPAGGRPPVLHANRGRPAVLRQPVQGPGLPVKPKTRSESRGSLLSGPTTVWFLFLQETVELVSRHGDEQEVVVLSPQPQGLRRTTDGGAGARHFGFITRSSRFVHQVLVPALMVTAGRDPVLLPSLSEGMEKMVRKTRSNARRLSDIERKTDAFVFRSRI